MWELERDPLVAFHAPLLVRALRTVGAPGIRSRATLGGSAAWSDRTSQLPATLLALHATLRTTTRTIRAQDHFARERGHALERGELIVAIEIPSAAGAGYGLHHVRRSHITWPVAGAVAVCSPSASSVGLYGAAPRPIAGTGDTPAEALAAALAQVDPFDDERARAPYRAAVVPELARRALADATGAL
jgi:carbon-monoxide dehydrogenase medium subunit